VRRLWRGCGPYISTIICLAEQDAIELSPATGTEERALDRCMVHSGDDRENFIQKDGIWRARDVGKVGSGSFSVPEEGKIFTL